MDKSFQNLHSVISHIVQTLDLAVRLNVIYDPPFTKKIKASAIFKMSFRARRRREAKHIINVWSPLNTFSSDNTCLPMVYAVYEVYGTSDQCQDQDAHSSTYTRSYWVTDDVRGRRFWDDGPDCRLCKTQFYKQFHFEIYINAHRKSVQLLLGIIFKRYCTLIWQMPTNTNILSGL